MRTLGVIFMCVVMGVLQRGSTPKVEEPKIIKVREYQLIEASERHYSIIDTTYSQPKLIGGKTTYVAKTSITKTYNIFDEPIEVVYASYWDGRLTALIGPAYVRYYLVEVKLSADHPDKWMAMDYYECIGQEPTSTIFDREIKTQYWVKDERYVIGGKEAEHGHELPVSESEIKRFVCK